LIKQDTLENKNKQIFWFSKNSYDKRKSEIRIKKFNNYPLTPQGNQKQNPSKQVFSSYAPQRAIMTAATNIN
jgi:hypothetical protein